MSGVDSMGGAWHWSCELRVSGACKASVTLVHLGGFSRKDLEKGRSSEAVKSSAFPSEARSAGG